MSRFAEINKFEIEIQGVKIQCKKIPLNEYIAIAESGQKLEDGDDNMEKTKKLLPFFEDVVTNYSDVTKEELVDLSAGDLIYIAKSIMRESSPKVES